MSFMKKFSKNIDKDPDISIGNLPDPQYYMHSGCYSLNKLMSGRLDGAIPQGRLLALGGHSSSGKSLVGASIVGETIRQGGMALIVDSEQSLDVKYLSACGVDVDNENYMYTSTPRIQKCSKIVNEFIKMYKAEGCTEKSVVLVDSLDMLFTDSEQEDIDKKGELGGDMGQRAKQLKRMLMSWVHSIGRLNISIICTKQVYQQQDAIKARSEPWVFTSALEYPFSQIIIFEKLVLKNKTKTEHIGFTMKASSYKNRFAQEKQVVKVEVPFDNGLDPYVGILEIAEDYGVIDKRGAWYYLGDVGKQGQAKAEADLEFMKNVLEKTMEVDDKSRFVYANLDDYTAESDSPTIDHESALSKRKKKAEKLKKEAEDEAEAEADED